MIWNYKLTTNTIWLSFDYGKVVANSIEEAREKATQRSAKMRKISLQSLKI